MLSGRGLIRIILFFAFIIIARFLSPEEFGWFGIVTTTVALASTLGSLGLRQAFAYEIGQGRMEPADAGLTALILWPLLGGASALVVLGILLPSFPTGNPNQLALVIAISVFGALLLMMLQGISLGTGKITVFAMSETIPRVVLLLGIFLLAIVGWMGLLSVLWLQAVGFFIAALYLLLFLFRSRKGMKNRLRALPRLLSYGVVFALNIFLVTLASRISMFVIQYFDGPESSGMFFAAVRVSDVFLEIATAVGLVLFSFAARSENSRNVLERTSRIVGWMVWAFLVIAAVVFFAAPFLVRLLLGSDYLPASQILQILALSLAPTSAHKMIYPAIAGTGQPLFGTFLLMGGLLVGTILSLWLVPQYGAVGGAWALVGGQWFLFVSYLVLCKFKLGLAIRPFLLPYAAEARDMLTRLRHPRK